MDLRPVLYLIGLLLGILSLGMLVAAGTDLYYHNPDWKSFVASALFTGFFSCILVLSCQQERMILTAKHAFLFTGFSWILLPGFSALPFLFSDLGMSLHDAIFEAVSGITTTGATVMTGLEDVPPGILIWRALLQWLGGIGIIVMAISLLPMLKVGGMQLFRLESSTEEKVTPKFSQMVKGISWVYLSLTLLCAWFYMMSGMGGFDAIAHAMTTISTGGFSTFDASLAHFDAPTHYVAIAFMWLGCLPFILFLRGLKGSAADLYRDTQVRAFFLFIAVITAAIIMIQFFGGSGLNENLFRESLFTVTALMSGTGYANTDYMAWGGMIVAILFFTMCIGGCAGSTSCGIKIFRFQILASIAHSQIRRLVYPNGVFPPMYNGRPISTDIALAVLGFVFMFALIFSIIAILISATGVDFMTAMSATLACLSNVGPGLGSMVGPTGTYAGMSDAAKWILSLAMLLGRLELFTLLVLLTPAFWRR